MKFNPDIQRRRSIRLRGYDYSQAGAYFVTICAQERKCLFGEIADDEMRLNDAGHMVGRWYAELPKKFPNIRCDEFVCMPNHIHFIVATIGADPCIRPNDPRPNVDVTPVGADLRVRPNNVRPNDAQPNVFKGEFPDGFKGEHIGSPLHKVVQWFKTMTTNEYIRGVKEKGWPPFPGKLWQRNYYEHIIRNEDALLGIRQYIHDNPAQWAFDNENPECVSRETNT